MGRVTEVVQHLRRVGDIRGFEHHVGISSGFYATFDGGFRVREVFERWSKV